VLNARAVIRVAVRSSRRVMVCARNISRRCANAWTTIETLPPSEGTAQLGEGRAAFLRAHPLCECDECKAQGRVLAASVVDHRVPHRGDMRLFWDSSNWQALSKSCHDRKTARDDGGFGNARATRDAKNGAIDRSV
jgi:5-methylcytosine-specific restriction endonuclease McrA